MEVELSCCLADDQRSDGLDRVLRDYLGRVRLASLKFIKRCNEVKVLEALAICEGLLNIISLNVWSVVVESDCFEVMNLLFGWSKCH